MNNIFIFDVDGTLTPSRQMMDQSFQKFFKGWVEKNHFFLVSGSDLDKLKEQLPEEYLQRALGVFCCSGNKLYINDELQYENKFDIPDELLKYLEDTLDNSDYPIKAGNHIEDRGSMLNFSMVGRKCTLQERKDYFEYDNLTGERENITKHIRENWTDIDAVIGGQISIDIYPKGKDKAQILDYMQKILKTKVTQSYHAMRYIFIGDRIVEGGNDFTLAKEIEYIDNARVHQVEGWRKTWWHLQRYELEMI